MPRKPFTDNHFRVLYHAFHGTLHVVPIETRRVRTRTINEMVAAKLVYGGVDGGTLTLAGLRAYVDMCERYDAESGCMAYAQRAAEARAALAAQVPA